MTSDDSLFQMYWAATAKARLSTVESDDNINKMSVLLQCSIRCALSAIKNKLGQSRLVDISGIFKN